MASHFETCDPVPAPVLAGLNQDMVVLARFFDQLAPGAKPLELTADTALLASGLLDSLAILQLTVFLSEEFGITIGDEDFTLENFATVGSLLEFIAAKRVE